MAKQITFFHGGGSKEDFDADEKLADSLKHHLGSDYTIHYPYLPNDGTPDLGRRAQISSEISASNDGVILIAHSLGASMLLACLSENEFKTKIAGILLIATPFWEGDKDWVKPFELQSGFAERIDKSVPLFFYHCHDDEEVPFDQLDHYKKQLPWATFREIPTGGHQFDNDLTVVAQDVLTL